MKEIMYSDLYDKLTEVLDEVEKGIVRVKAMRARTKEQGKRPDLYLVTQKEMDRLRGTQ